MKYKQFKQKMKKLKCWKHIKKELGKNIKNRYKKANNKKIFISNGFLWEKGSWAFWNNINKKWCKAIDLELNNKLNKAIKKYTYNFKAKELDNSDLKKWFISFNFKTNKFKVDYSKGQGNYLSIFDFKSKKKAKLFMKNFTTDELMQIMKGEIK